MLACYIFGVAGTPSSKVTCERELVMAGIPSPNATYERKAKVAGKLIEQDTRMSGGGDAGTSNARREREALVARSRLPDEDEKGDNTRAHPRRMQNTKER